MKTKIKYYLKGTQVESRCGSILEIEESSRNLGWEGVLLEKGTSKHFHPKDVETPNFYFAVELENKYVIEVVDGEKTFLKETAVGDIWINPPNTPFTHNIDEPCNFIIVTIDKEKLFNSFIGNRKEELLFLNNYGVRDKVLLNLIELLYVETKKNGVNGSWYIDNVISLIANYFIRNYTNYNDLKNNHTQIEVITDKEIVRVTEYIRKNINEIINIENLAKELNMSKFYFLREFKEYVGITPYQYIINMKIEYSKQLLKDEKESITQIALSLGFNDSSHFSKTFKAHEGVSPKVFRKNFLQKT